MKRDALPPHEALLQFLYQAPIGLLQTTLDGEILMMNPVSAQLLMPLAPDGNLNNLFDVLAPVSPTLRQLAQHAPENGATLCENLRIYLGENRPGGGPRSLALSMLRLDAQTLMASLTDTTLSDRQEQQRLASHLRDATRTDALTALPNRSVVLECIAQAQRHALADPAYQFAVLFINADRFHRTNLTLGMAAGDSLLRLMAGRLGRTLRPHDAVGLAVEPTAGRLGGDEFVVVLEALREADDVHGIAQRLVEALQQPYGIEAHQVHASISLGVVLRAQAVGDAESVLQDASIAMREAKRDGGARYRLFEPAMKTRATLRGSLESELRTALAEAQLYVVYQPIVQLASGRCTGVEALVRWQHPQRGTVPPVEFIGLAEECGLIGALGQQVLELACAQFAAWRGVLGEAAPETLSVNLSRAQLAEPGLVEAVAHSLQRHSLPAGCLQLEVTESLAAQDACIQLRLHELKALGLTLALDDFGTGYSSLSSLHQLPVDVVKIDRSFVAQSETSHHHRVLIEATVSVARSLGMGTVAEGVETPGQAALLHGLQCAKGQGYWFARPLAAEAFSAWLLKQPRGIS